LSYRLGGRLLQLSLKELADRLQLSFQGDPDYKVFGVLPLQIAGPTSLSFCRSEKQASELARTKAGILLLPPSLVSQYAGNALIATDTVSSLIQVLHLFHPKKRPQVGCHSTAVIHPSVNFKATVSIGPHVVIGAHVYIGDRVVIGAGCSIGDNCSLGDDVNLAPNVVLYDRVRLGNRVSVHAGTVIGADGFGYHREGFAGPWEKIPQVGGVTVEDDVEIGASTTIDRGALVDTLIAKGAKIDNQVMIAHNVSIGENTAIAACSGIAGSTKIGSNCILAGHCGVADNLTITDQVILLGKAAVSNSIKEPGVYGSGTGLLKASTWFRLVARLRNLDKTIKTINQKLENKDD
jgi:UDP-3-O-[3-hydroxymyristoyl] glucosamine N-acyltransferase